MLIESSPFQSIDRPDLESNEFVESASAMGQFCIVGSVV